MSTAKSKDAVKELVMAAMCLALCMFLPFLTGQIPQIGSMLAPMHIPVLLCGFVCAWPWAAAVGFAAPLLRSFLFGMPPFVPVALAMAFELAAYGLAAALLYRLLPKKPGYVYAALAAAMLAGRLVWGAASLFIYGAMGAPFTGEMFLAGAFVTAAPGIAAHILLIPPLVLALKKAGLVRA